MNKKRLIAILITVLFLFLVFYKIDFVKLIETFKDFNTRNLFWITCFYISTLYLRGIRWKYLLLNDKKYTSYHLGTVFTVGSMLNTYLPARAGDIYRAYYLGKTKQEKKMKLFGNVILERTLDGISVFFILLFAVLFYFKQAWILSLTYSVGALFIGCFVTFYLIFKFNKVDFVFDKLVYFSNKLPYKVSNVIIDLLSSLKKHIHSFIEGFEVLNSLKYTTLSFFMSIIIWGIECYVAYLILTSFSLGLSFSASLFVISLVSFSTMIPSTSVFLGPYQVAYILALGIYGIDKSTTLAVSTIHQTLLMIILTIIGLIYFLKFNLEIKNNK